MCRSDELMPMQAFSACSHHGLTDSKHFHGTSIQAMICNAKLFEYLFYSHVTPVVLQLSGGGFIVALHFFLHHRFDFRCNRRRTP